MDISSAEGAEWTSSTILSARFELSALLQLLIRKKTITDEEFLNELSEILSDEHPYSVRSFVAQSEQQLRDGPWHIGGAEATEQLGRRLELRRGDIVLDVGCGAGGPARQIAETFGCEVIGIDIRLSRIVEAMLRTSALGLGKRVTFHVGEGERLPFEDAAFDVLFSQGTWDHVPDKRGLVREAFRVLKPGGRLGVECEALTNETRSDMSDTGSRRYRVAEWRERLETTEFQDVEIEELWEESLAFYDVGPEKEEIDRKERVNVRITARKP